MLGAVFIVLASGTRSFGRRSRSLTWFVPFVVASLIAAPESGAQTLFDLAKGNADHARGLVVHEGRLYFVTGGALWYYDAASELVGGPFTVGDSRCEVSVYPDVTAYEGKLFFQTGGVVSCVGLWSLDSDSDHIELEVGPVDEFGESMVGRFAVYDGALFFLTRGYQGDGIWRFDSSTGTAERLDAAQPEGLSEIGEFAVVQDRLYFSGGGDHSESLFYFDAGLDTVVLAADFMHEGLRRPRNLTAVDDRLYFSADGTGPSGSFSGSFWMHDGASGRTEPLAGSTEFQNVYEITAFAGRLYFGARHAESGYELWSYDPASDRAKRVTDVCPGTCNSYPGDLTPHDGLLFFSATTEEGGARSLWSYDPGSGRVRQHVESAEPTALKDPEALTSYAGRLYFGARDVEQGYELFSFDAGTNTYQRVADVLPSQAGSSPRFVGSYEDVVFFLADDRIHGAEMWVYDGGRVRRLAEIVDQGDLRISGEVIGLDGKLYAGGFLPEVGSGLAEIDLERGTATIVATICPGSCSLVPRDFVLYHGKIFMTADDGVHGTELWYFDPSSGQASLAADVWAGPQSSMPRDLTVFDGGLYFSADDSTFGHELWIYDGRTARAERVADVRPGIHGSVPRDLVVYDRKLFFVASDSTGGGLWYHEGGSKGRTRKVETGLNVLCSCTPWALVAYADRLYFVASDGIHGYELWYYDPPSGELAMVADLNPGPGSSGPSNMTVFDERLFFYVRDDGSGGSRLMVHDAAKARTEPARDVLGIELRGAHIMYAAGNHFFVNGDDGIHGSELWVFSKHDLRRGELPAESLLLSNAPNPFVKRTQVYYTLFEPSRVVLEAYDILGRRVATLVDGDEEPGSKHVTFDAASLSSGLYLIRAQVGKRSETLKITLVR